MSRPDFRPRSHARPTGAAVAADPRLRAVNHDDLPIVYAPKFRCAAPLESSFVPVARSLAIRFAACSLAVIAVAGCSTPGAIGPTANVQPKLAGQPVSLDTFAYDPTPTGAVPLPSPSSQAVATTEPGDGQMIGSSSKRQRGGASDANIVLNLSSVPLQQAAKTVLGDMIGVNYVIDPRVDGVVSVQTTQPVNSKCSRQH
jgi:general secretion pathway protein D